MAVMYSIGDTWLDSAELQEKSSLGMLEDFVHAIDEGGDDTIEVSTGTVSAADVRGAEQDPLGFVPVGINKPLTLELIAAYTGDAPGRSFFDRVVGRSKPDLLIASAAKTPEVFAAAPKAINQLVPSIEDKQSYRPGATRDGSPIIYHSPGMVHATTFVSVEMVVDSFDGGVFDQVSSLMTAAAGLPVFAPAATYLLAGAVAAKSGKKLAGALSETGPFLRADEDLRFDSAGFPIRLARFMLFASDTDIPKLTGYAPKVVEQAGNLRVVLADARNGEIYSGNIPFIIASLDGRPRPEYKQFKATHASAALLEQFYGKDSLAGAVGVLTDALTLYNDVKFRRAAERVIAELKALPQDSKERKAAEERLDAYLQNIQTDDLKPAQ